MRRTRRKKMTMTMEERETVKGPRGPSGEATAMLAIRADNKEILRVARRNRWTLSYIAVVTTIGLFLMLYRMVS
jgi:hypothetical protein